VRATTRGSCEAVYNLLADAPSWSSWAGPLISSSSWEVEPAADGSGGIRRLGHPRFMVREEVVVADPPVRHAYRLLSGQPVHSYRAEVLIGSAAEGVTAADAEVPTGRATSGGSTSIEWTGEVAPLIPGTGPVMEFLLRAMLRDFARRLASAAESETL
jgi:Polyketide cyclase / dehydrase and lipid transport